MAALSSSIQLQCVTITHNMRTYLCVRNGPVDALVSTIISVGEARESMLKHTIQGVLHFSKGRNDTAAGEK